MDAHDGLVEVPQQQVLSRFVMPSAYIGIGGHAKPVFPRLEAHFQRHYGFRPDCLQMAMFDFDPALAEMAIDGQTFSIQPYLKVLPKKALLDFARQWRRKTPQVVAFMQRFAPYVALDQVRAVDAPGLNLFVQSGNLAWRLVWEQHVLPELKAKVRCLHPDPHTQGTLARQGLAVSSRSTIWVVAGGGSTTVPTGLLPFLCELKRLKPPQTNLFAMVFTPSAYRDKTTQHQLKGRAIFRATMEQLLALYEGQDFDQPYGTDGYRITLHEEPFDQLFLVDGSLMGGRTELTSDALADLVALFLFKIAIGPIGERLLGTISNLNSVTQEEQHDH